MIHSNVGSVMSGGEARLRLMDYNFGGVIDRGGFQSQHPVDAAEEQDVRAKISVWWDIENCPAPKDNPHNIAKNISSALVKLNYCGPLSISAYGDTTRISPMIQQALNSTGIALNHVPADAKDASDKKILVDMLFWAVDNPAPANYLLISGDRDFSNALHQLRMRRYTVLLAQPHHASASLVAAAKSVWLWTSLAAGGPPITINESSQLLNNGYGFASSSQPFIMGSIHATQTFSSFNKSLRSKNQKSSKVPSSRNLKAAKRSKIFELARKKSHLAPTRNVGKKPTSAQKVQPPICNLCKKPHFRPCRQGKTHCHNCGKEGHMRKTCPEVNQQQNTPPGHMFTMNQAGDEAHHANIAGDVIHCYNCGKEGHKRNTCSEVNQQQNTPPGHMFTMIQAGDEAHHANIAGDVIHCYNCGKEGHMRKTCPELNQKQNTPPGHVFKMIQAGDEANHANTAGDLESSLKLNDSNSHCENPGDLESSLKLNDLNSHSEIQGALDSCLSSNDLKMHSDIQGDLDSTLRPNDLNSHSEIPGEGAPCPSTCFTSSGELWTI